MKKILLIGDSIRIGYQDEVKKQLANQAEFFAPIENGGDSRNVKSNLHQWVIDQSPDVLHINCGLHDIKREFSSGQIAVPLAEYKANLQRILIVATSAIETVIWATITPVNQEWHRKKKGFDRLTADVLDYNQVAVSVAHDLGLQVNDLYRTITDVGINKCLISDGVHFSQSGSIILGQAVVKAIMPHIHLTK